MPDPAAREAVLTVRAHPRAAREAVGPVVAGVLEVRVTRPATDGQANAAVRRLVAGALGVAPSRLRLVSGERARTKRFVLEGVDAAQLAARLERIRNAGD